jgi:hypothetical protein
MLKPDKELINFWLSHAKSYLLWGDPEHFLIHGFSPVKRNVCATKRNL